ncbi:BQ2448_4165 [Microbotryum intermedium]|uniref:BQ2448_4165 protein n=1 Tax=Microbotryum intermedium TaxID=269621 RepID=A0A238FN53_9BASI|nr:BQ2448_4165 [Microbotryum intermedium]
MLSEDNKDIIIRTVEYAKTVAHYGWIPLILWVGYTNSTPRPNLIKQVTSPSASSICCFSWFD